MKDTYKILLQRSANDLYISLWGITVFREHVDISCSTELLYVSKVGSLFTNQRASKFGWECQVNFDLHLKCKFKKVDILFKCWSIKHYCTNCSQCKQANTKQQIKLKLVKKSQLVGGRPFGYKQSMEEQNLGPPNPNLSIAGMEEDYQSSTLTAKQYFLL